MHKPFGKAIPTALDGIRIVDLSQGWAGPSATMLLADQGADVIKVEPLWGDQARDYFANPPIEGQERGFLAINRSKRGVAIHMKKEKGKAILYRLIKGADVLVHNFRPGVPERLSIQYDKLEGMNPRLIYVSLSAYGRKGPLADHRAYDVVLQALAGAMRRLPDGSPMCSGTWMSDCSTAMMMAYAICLALFVRERTGRGDYVDMSLFNQTLYMQLPDFVRTEEELNQRNQKDFKEELWDYHTPCRCKDGQYLVTVAMTNEQWKSLCRVLGIAHLSDDPRCESALGRFQNGHFIHGELQRAFLKKSSEEWVGALQDADVPHAPVLSKEEVFRHPQVLENQMVMEVAHPIAGLVKMLGIPFRLSRSPGAIRGPSPLLGQHTREILRELGYDDAEIAAMDQENVIRLYE